MRVIDFFDRGADRYPDRDFIIDPTGRRSYRDAQALTHRIAARLQADGMAPQTKIAVYSPNTARAFECVLGIFRAGAVWVPANARNAIDENCELLRNLEVKIVFFHSSFDAQMQVLKENCPQIDAFVCIDGPAAAGPAFEDWIADVPQDARVDMPADLHDPVAIFATGGTTGTPKGAVWSARQFEVLTANFFASMPPRAVPVHLVTAPLTHAAGCFALMLNAAGATHVILPSADPLYILEAIEREKITFLYLPPTVIYMMLAHPRLREFDYSSVEYFMYGAAPMSAEKLRQALDAFGPVMAQSYGQMEAPGFCTFLSPADHVAALATNEKRLLSCGRSTLLTEVAVMDDDGNLLADDAVGEVVVRGGLVMKGYYNNAKATEEVSGHGWHHTGDLGYRDAEGYFYIVDRKKDMIITGGFNVFPGEVEQVIWSNDSVQDCAVIGVPDEKWGEAVKAVVQMKPNGAVTESELIALCKARLGSVKAPKSVEFWDDLPRTSVGKVKKKEIRQTFWAGHERQV